VQTTRDSDARDISIDREELYELASAVLSRGSCFTFVAKGVSMLPFIHGGDRLTIAPCQGGDLRRGDVAFYVGEGGALVVHRFLGCSRDGITLLMRGDAAWRVPERVAPSQVLGRVLRVQRRSGRWRTPGRMSRMAALLWHGLYPYPLRLYQRISRWRAERRGAVARQGNPEM